MRCPKWIFWRWKAEISRLKKIWRSFIIACGAFWSKQSQEGETRGVQVLGMSLWGKCPVYALQAERSRGSKRVPVECKGNQRRIQNAITLLNERIKSSGNKRKSAWAALRSKRQKTQWVKTLHLSNENILCVKIFLVEYFLFLNFKRNDQKPKSSKNDGIILVCPPGSSYCLHGLFLLKLWKN